jgi:NAD(P)-dependent dehydrogenase (short-subunit alcohol dehydrogenase family)
MTDLKQKAALVTGSGRGLGRGIAQALAEAGACVMVSDLVDGAVAESVAALRRAGHTVEGVAANVTSEESMVNAIQATVNAFGKLDILVNNAGVVALDNALDIPLKDWDLLFDVNVKGLFMASQLAARQMIAQGSGGSIVNVASNAGKVGFPAQAHYNATKAAVINLTRSMALELAPHKINVNAVCPGAVDTPMLFECAVWITERNGGDPHTLVQTFAPPQLGRLIQPIEVGRVVAFLASDEAVIIRGQSINVDAGATPY